MIRADATGRDSEATDAPNELDRLELDESQIDAGESDAIDPGMTSDARAEDHSQRLAFGDDDVQLPWLQSDDEDDAAASGHNAGQTISLALLGLLALGIIGGGIWWASQSSSGDSVVEAGGVIEAPDQPYKERPKNPGGKTFAGTGDTSFAVSEGQTRPVRLDDSAARAAEKVPAPAGAAAKGGASAAAQPAEVGGVGVQVAAYSNRAQAEAGWARLSQQYSGLSGFRHRIVEGQADIGTVYRLQAVAGDLGAANALCRDLRGAGLACQVKN